MVSRKEKGPDPAQYEIRLYHCPRSNTSWRAVHLRTGKPEECVIHRWGSRHPAELQGRLAIEKFFLPDPATEVELHRAKVLGQVRKQLKNLHQPADGDSIYAYIAAYMWSALGSAPTTTMFLRFATAVVRALKRKPSQTALQAINHWSCGERRVVVSGSKVMPEVVRAGDGYTYFDGLYWLVVPGKPLDRRVKKKARRKPTKALSHVQRRRR